MPRGVILALAVVLAFALGMGARHWGSDDAARQQQLAAQQQRIDELTRRNDELSQTLRVVKQQVRADRIAYAGLQETLEQSAAAREALQAQLNQTRELLRELRDNLSRGVQE